MIKKFKLYKGYVKKEETFLNDRVVQIVYQKQHYFYNEQNSLILIRKPNVFQMIFSKRMPLIDKLVNAETTKSIKTYKKYRN